MSQSGRLRTTAGSLPPSVPLQFTADSGIAVPIANNLNVLGDIVIAGSIPVKTVGIADTVTLEVQTTQAIAATDATKIGLSAFNSAQFTVDANGFVSLVGGGGTDLHVARYIVSAGGITDGANYTTISTAYAAAVLAGGVQTVFVQPGTYTENLTLSPNVNLTAFPCDAFTPAVTIVGKITSTITGTVSISNIRLQTNGDYFLECTGSNSGTVNFIGCYLIAGNANGIHLTNANSVIQLWNCFGDCSTNTYFIATGGGIKVFHSNLASGSNTTTNSTFANANFESQYSYMSFPITTSGTGSVSLFKSQIVCTNTTCLTHGGSGSSISMETRYESGTASAISIGSSLQVLHCSIFSTNTNAITGAGGLFYAFIVFYGTAASSGVNTGSQAALATLI